jgi:HK97 family phage major capsid protein
MNRIKQLSERRGQLIKQAEAIVNLANGDKRSVRTDENNILESNRSEILRIDRELERETRELQLQVASHESALPLAGYSLTRAIRQASAGRLEGLEREISDEIQMRSGKAPTGFYIPHSLLGETRAMSVSGTSGTVGGDYVGTVNRGFIDALRPLLKIAMAGAEILDGLTSNISIPRQAAASTASWKAETAALDESTPVIDQMELTPRRVGSYTILSKQLLIQASNDVERLVRNDLLAACATALDVAAINGAGGTAPTGILATSGIGAVVGGTNGAAPDWADIIALISSIETVDALAGRPAFLINPATAAKLRATAKVASTDSRMILEGNDLLGYPVHISSNVPSNLTKGSASGICSAIIFGNFNDVVLASFGEGIDLIVDPFTNATSGQTRVIANSYVDVGVRRPASFAAMKDALTA